MGILYARVGGAWEPVLAGTGGDITQAEADATYLKMSGGTMTGVLTMATGVNISAVDSLISCKDASTGVHAMNRQSADARYVNLTGDTMSGALDMDNNTIQNLPFATGAGQPVSRGYGDTRYAMVDALTAHFNGNYVEIGGDVIAGGVGVNLSTNGIVRATVGNLAVGTPNIICDRIQGSGAAAIGQPFIRFDRLGVGIGNITIGPDASHTAYNTDSDYRLKDVLGPLTGALDRLSRLNPISFRWKAAGTTSEGFLAHEVQEVVPLAITGVKDAEEEDGTIKPQMIDHSKLVPLLTAAVQELTQRVTALEAV